MTLHRDRVQFENDLSGRLSLWNWVRLRSKLYPRHKYIDPSFNTVEAFVVAYSLVSTISV